MKHRRLCASGGGCGQRWRGDCGRCRGDGLLSFCMAGMRMDALRGGRGRGPGIGAEHVLQLLGQMLSHQRLLPLRHLQRPHMPRGACR